MYISRSPKANVKLLFYNVTYFSTRQIDIKSCNPSHSKMFISCSTLNCFTPYFFQHILCIILTDTQLGWIFLYKLLRKQQEKAGKCTSSITWRRMTSTQERIFTFISLPASLFSFVYGGFHSWILSSLRQLVSFDIKYFFCAILLKQEHNWKRKKNN